MLLNITKSLKREYIEYRHSIAVLFRVIQFWNRPGSVIDFACIMYPNVIIWKFHREFISLMMTVKWPKNATFGLQDEYNSYFRGLLRENQRMNREGHTEEVAFGLIIYNYFEYFYSWYLFISKCIDIQSYFFFLKHRICFQKRNTLVISLVLTHSYWIWCEPVILVQLSLSTTSCHVHWNK